MTIKKNKLCANFGAKIQIHSPSLKVQVLVQQGPWLGLQSLFGFNVQGFSWGGKEVLWGQQQSSSQSSSQPQSHSSPASTTPFPQRAFLGSITQK